MRIQSGLRQTRSSSEMVEILSVCRVCSSSDTAIPYDASEDRLKFLALHLRNAAIDERN